MWIIQEVINAKSITVWCGVKSFEWQLLNALYLKLKKIEDTGWLHHHSSAAVVLQSSACVMVWQRAHWRHPETPVPKIQMLIEVFRDWKCTDVRDKVFALSSMADRESSIVPDYSLSARDVYFAVRKRLPDAKAQFFNLLSQLLGLSGRDLGFYDQDLLGFPQSSLKCYLLTRF
jgi:hypothetical protein